MHLDVWVRVADGAAIVRGNVGHATTAKLHAADLKQQPCRRVMVLASL
jgi:hypothetical protein